MNYWRFIVSLLVLRALHSQNSLRSIRSSWPSCSLIALLAGKLTASWSPPCVRVMRRGAVTFASLFLLCCVPDDVTTWKMKWMLARSTCLYLYTCARAWSYKYLFTCVTVAEVLRVIEPVRWGCHGTLSSGSLCARKCVIDSDSDMVNTSSLSHVLSTSDLLRHMVPCDVLRTFVAVLTFGVNFAVNF
jgi:hypothetical protein